MGNFQINDFTYHFTNGQATSVQVGFYSQNTPDGEYINASIRVKPDDLPTDKTFLQVAMEDMIKIAREKLATDAAVKEDNTTTK